MNGIAVEETNHPGIEKLSLRETVDGIDERLVLSNSVGNGLRLDILNDDIGDWACFHIETKETAQLIARRLLEYSERITNPPNLFEVPS